MSLTVDPDTKIPTFSKIKINWSDNVVLFKVVVGGLSCANGIGLGNTYSDTMVYVTVRYGVNRASTCTKARATRCTAEHESGAVTVNPGCLVTREIHPFTGTRLLPTDGPSINSPVYSNTSYGEEELFNPFCPARTLLMSIKQKCRCRKDFDIELCDESGNIKFLREVPNRYANEFLTDRETLVLLRVDKSTLGTTDTYIPLLNDDVSINDEFIARLSGRDSRPGSRRVRSNTRRPRVEKSEKNGERDRSKEKLKSARPEKRSGGKSRQGK